MLVAFSVSVIIMVMLIIFGIRGFQCFVNLKRQKEREFLRAKMERLRVYDLQNQKNYEEGIDACLGMK